MNEHIAVETKLTPTRWQKGRVRRGNFTYTARVFPEPSKWGIENGEVSKLEIRDKDRKIVANYDRQWDEIPVAGSAAAEAVEQIVAFYRENAKHLPDEPPEPPDTEPVPSSRLFPWMTEFPKGGSK